MHFLTHFLVNLSGCTVQNIQPTKKCTFNHPVKLAKRWENNLWEVNVAFPRLSSLGYGGEGVGRQRLLGSVSLEGFLSHRDSEMLQLVAASLLAHTPSIHWNNLCPNVFSGVGNKVWPRRTQCVISGIPERCWCSYSGQKSAGWQPGNEDVLMSAPLLTPGNCCSTVCGFPIPGQRDFLFQSLSWFIFSPSGTFRPLFIGDHNQIYPN